MQDVRHGLYFSIAVISSTVATMCPIWAQDLTPDEVFNDSYYDPFFEMLAEIDATAEEATVTELELMITTQEPDGQTAISTILFPDVIPPGDQSGDLTDAITTLGEAFFKTYEDEIIAALADSMPVPFEIANDVENWAEEHEILAIALGGTALTGTTLVVNEWLENYGEEYGIDSLTIPIPRFEISDVDLWFYEYPVTLTIGGDLEINTAEPDVILLEFGIIY